MRLHLYFVLAFLFLIFTWFYLLFKFDILRDLIKTNKIACADVFKLIYDKNLEKYRLPILSFIRTNFPDFTLTDKEADEALDFFVKNKDLVAVETILKMGAKPEKLSKDDLVEFITLVYLFRPGSDLDLWNTKKNMLQKIEELVKNGHISGDVFFDSFFKNQ